MPVRFLWIFANPQRFPLTDDGFSEELHRPLIDKTLETMYNTGVKLEINPHFAESCGENLDAVYPGRRSIAFVSGSVSSGTVCSGALSVSDILPAGSSVSPQDVMADDIIIAARSIPRIRFLRFMIISPLQIDKIFVHFTDTGLLTIYILSHLKSE